MNDQADRALLEALADGRWHSGEDLARILGVTRAAVWKRLKKLERFPGVALERAPSRGYRLTSPLELLMPERIRAHLSPSAAARIGAMEVHLQVDSTNARAQRLAPTETNRCVVVLAEHQTAGRGRRGRRWHSPLGGGLWFSLAWRFDLPLADLGGLSLAVGAVVASVLEEEGLEGHVLKWPNDLLFDGRKLAGILVEASGEAGGPCLAVVGIGINLRLDEASARSIDQPWIDLEQVMAAPPARNRLAGRMVQGVVEGCLRYGDSGLSSFLEVWRRRDGFRGRPVRLEGAGGGVRSGLCLGVDADGALLLETGSGVERHHAGELSLRGGGDE